MATLMGVLAFDVLAGLMIGVLVSLVGLMSRAVRPRIMWLGKDSKSGRLCNRDDDGVDIKQDISVIHFGAELFFANVGTLRDSVIAEVDERHPRAVVIDPEAITDIDTTAADELAKLHTELASRDVTLAFASLAAKLSVRHDEPDNSICPPLRANSRLIVDGARPNLTATHRIDSPAATPLEISSRSRSDR